MRRLISAMVLVLAACAGTETGGTGSQMAAMDTEFMQALTVLAQLDLFDRAAVERDLHTSLQPYEQLTIPPRVAYRSVDSAMAPFAEATYETRNKQSWATLALWLDDARCYSMEMISDKYDLQNMKFETIDPGQEEHGVKVVLSYLGHKNKLLVGYRKTSAGDYCAKNIVINSQRKL